MGTKQEREEELRGELKRKQQEMDELVLRSEEGIEEVRANPLTGRVLVRYRPGSVSESVKTLLSRAVEAGPMSVEEFAVLRSEQPRSGRVHSL